MRLDQALVEQKLCESRTEAQELIKDGHVLVDGIVVKKQTREIRSNEKLEVTQRRKFVSRGGNKLESALLHIFHTEELITQNVEGKQAIDIGSSTGGFTDCLLHYGVSTVTAVDVGTDQLHTKLRNTSPVSLFENTDIRNFKSQLLFDYVVADLSFIPLEKVINTIVSLGATGSQYFLLIKPQFEVGYGNTKKGIVKDQKLVDGILEKYKKLLESKGFIDIAVFPSKVVGGDGNQEYFLYGIK